MVLELKGVEYEYPKGLGGGPMDENMEGKCRTIT